MQCLNFLVAMDGDSGSRGPAFQLALLAGAGRRDGGGCSEDSHDGLRM